MKKIIPLQNKFEYISEYFVLVYFGNGLILAARNSITANLKHFDCFQKVILKVKKELPVARMAKRNNNCRNIVARENY